MYEGVYSDYSGLDLNLDAHFNSQLPNIAQTPNFSTVLSSNRSAMLDP